MMTTDLAQPSQFDLPARRRRWVLSLLLLVCAGGASWMLRDVIRWENLVEREAELREFQAEHPVVVLALASALYVVVTGLSIPGATVLTLLYAWYLGFWSAVVVVSFSSTAGATCAFWLSRYLFRDWVRARFGGRLQVLQDALARDGAYYLLTLRLLPTVPFFVINAAMGLTGLSTRTFWWASQLGMLPATLIYVYAGSRVPSLEVFADRGVTAVFTATQWTQCLLALTALGAFPWLAKWVSRRVLRPRRDSLDDGSAAEQIILFVRYPEPGRAKTRLIPAVGAEGAAQVHALLATATLQVAKEACRAPQRQVSVRFTGGGIESVRAWLGTDGDLAPQFGSDLGQRLEQAIQDAFTAGVRRVVVVGTDCPELSAELLERAFAALRTKEIVLGPAHDGGYYLIGLRAPHPDLFHRIDWGSEHVLRQTVAIAKRRGLDYELLPPLSDVDYPEDLVVCRRHAGDAAWGPLPARRADWLSIVIPTWQEANRLEQTLAPLLGEPNVELIVADGGSHDGTAEVARRLGVRVVMSRRSRGRQLNAGGAVAAGGTLLFLHADTRLPPDFRQQVDRVLASGAIAGAFRLGIDAEGIAYRWIERGANLRSRYAQRPYGDQALFLTAATFFQLGGFPNWPLLEDYQFCRRLSRLGVIRLASGTVRTSARRWLRRGCFRTTCLNQAILAAFHLGVTPDRLASWYRR